MKKHSHLLTELEIKRLYEYSVANPGFNIWVEHTPTGIGDNVRIYKQNLFNKGSTVVKVIITDLDNW
jgi:hypothetical protein